MCPLPIARVPHCPCAQSPLSPSRCNRYWQYSLNTWSWTCSPCAHVISQVSKRCQVVKKMSSCQKDVKYEKVKYADYGGGSQKNKLTSWGSQILMSILTSNMKVTKIAQKYFLWTFWGFLVTITCDIKIDINMCEPHCVNLFFFVNLLHSSGVWFFDIWHLFDNLTSFWQLDIFLTLDL